MVRNGEWGKAKAEMKPLNEEIRILKGVGALKFVPKVEVFLAQKTAVCFALKQTSVSVAATI